MSRKFNAASQRVVITNAPAFNIGGTGAVITVAAWLYTDATAASERRFVAKWNDANSQYQYMLAINSTEKALVGIDTLITGTTGLAGATTIPVKTWTHIAMTFDQNTLRCYVNGVEDASQTIIEEINATTTAPLKIGCGGSTTVHENRLTGRVADVGIWRAVLSPDQIYQLYRGSRPNQILPAYLAGYWPLEHKGLIEPDMSGRNNRGVVTGATSDFSPANLIKPVMRKLYNLVSSGTLYFQTVDSTATVTEDRLRTPNKILASPTTVTETRQRTPVKIIANAAAATESRLKQIIRALSNSVTITETRQRTQTRSINQSVTTTESRVKTPQKVLANAVTIVQALFKLIFRALANTSTVTDNRQKKPIRSITQSMTATETRNKIPGKLHNASSTVLTTQTKRIARSLSSAVSATENRIKSLQRSFLNSTTVLETRTKRIIKSLSQSSAVAETRAKSILRSLASTVTGTESRSKIPGKVSTNSVTIIETRKRDLTKVINTTVNVVVAAAKKFSLIIDTVVAASVTFSYELNSLITEITINVSVGINTTLAKMPKVIKSAQSNITQTLHKNIARAFNTSKAVTTTLSKQVIKVHGVVISAQSDISKRINKAFNTSIVVVTTAGRLFTQTINTVVVSATTMVTSINVVVEEIWRVTRQTVSFKTAQIVKSFKDTIRRVKW